MKIKDTGFFQQHVEKLILLAGGLFIVILVMVYIVGDPYKVEIHGQTMSTDEVEQRIVDAAASLQAKLVSSEGMIPNVPIPNYTDMFMQRGARAVNSVESLSSLGSHGLAMDIVAPAGEFPIYYLPRPSLAQDLKVRKGIGVLGDFEQQEEQDLFLKFVRNQQTRDINYVSVGASFDLDAWDQRLAAEAPEGSEFAKLPVRFWRGSRALTAVYLQRQERNPLTGEWGNIVLIEPLPDQLAYLPSRVDQYDEHTAVAIIDEIRMMQDRIARPEFPDLASNTQWISPDAEIRELSPDDNRRLKKIRYDIERKKKQVTQLSKRLTKQEERPDRAERGQPRERPRGRGGAERGGRNAGMPGGGGSLPGDPGADKGRAARAGGGEARSGVGARGGDGAADLATQLRNAFEELERLKAERDELIGVPKDAIHQDFNRYQPMGDAPGGPLPGDPGYMGRGGQLGGPLPGDPGHDRRMTGSLGGGGRHLGLPRRPDSGHQQQAPQSEEEDPSRRITVWAHDLTVEPGWTYRYRVVVSVLNPLFRQQRVSLEQRAEYFNKPSLGPDPQEWADSPWSDAVRIDPKFYFFMVSGNAANHSAEVEVWHVVDGRWHDEKFTVHPGDPIGRPVTITADGVQRTIDMHVGSIVVDLARETVGIRSGTRMLYLKQGSNRIASRTANEDRDSIDRVRLQNEKAIQRKLEEVALAE